MSIGEFLRVFWNDGKVEVLAILVALDFLLGIASALKTRSFRLSYIADFVRKDIIFKIGGYLLVYAGAVYAGQADIVIDGLDLGVIAGSVYVVIVAAMVGSVLNSIKELGLIPGVDPQPPAPPAPPLEMLTADEGV